MFQLLLPLITSMLGGAAGGGLASLVGGAAAGGMAATGAGALAAGAAAPAAATGIGALFGKAFLPALGSGIGTLLTGGSGADALRNAAFAGTGSALLGGQMGKLMGSPAAKTAKAGMQVANVVGGGQAPVPAPAPVMSSSPRPPPRPMDLGQNQGPPKGIMDAMNYTPPSSGPPKGIMSPMPYAPVPPAPVPPAPAPVSPLELMSAQQEQQMLGNGESFDTSRGISARQRMDAGDPGVASGYMDAFTGSRYPTNFERILQEQWSARNSAGSGPRIGKRGLYAQGGEISGPGDGTSDSVPAQIYQGGEPVQKAKLSDGEFVMTAKAVRNAGGGDRSRGINRMYELMRRFENGELA